MPTEIVNGQIFCKKCETWKDLEFIHKDNSRAPGYRPICKSCVNLQEGRKRQQLRTSGLTVPKGHGYCSTCRTIKPRKEFVKCVKQQGTCYACATPEQIATKERTYRKIQAYQRRKRSEQHGTDHEELDLPSIYAQFNNVCAYCGKKARLDADHFVPISRGGGYVITNIVPSCLQCNAAKNDNDPADWLTGRTDLYYSILNYFFQYMTEDQIYDKFNSGEWKVL